MPITDQPIPGGWTHQCIVLGEKSFELVLPADPDRFLDEPADAIPWLGEVDPYWARLWPTALTMAQLVATHSWRPIHRALELGCGIGVVGLAALSAGLEVLFTDRVPLAVDLALENARRNGLHGATGQILDWRHPLPERFSVILASDVIYDPQLHESLLSALDRLLTDDGVAWLGDPGRYHSDPFVAKAAQRGFATARHDARGQSVPECRPGEFQLLVLRKLRVES